MEHRPARARLGPRWGPGPTPTTTPAGTPLLAATQPGPAATVTATSSHIDTHGADATGATEPFELVLGQSVNAGWQAVATPGPGASAGSHAVDLGTPQLVDGFANGWPVTADDLHALGGSNFTVELTWTPQRTVWAALFVSGLTLVLCLVLGFLPVRARRWLRSRLPRRLRGPAGPDAPERPAVPFDAARLTWPGAPPPSALRRTGWLRFPAPWSSGRSPAPWRSSWCRQRLGSPWAPSWCWVCSCRGHAPSSRWAVSPSWPPDASTWSGASRCTTLRPAPTGTGSSPLPPT